MARLLLMRHAKSDWHSGEREDFLRPLNERGVRDARRMGRWLVDAGCRPDVIVSSPARRTRDTLRYLAEGAGESFAAITRFEARLYLGAVGDLCAVLADIVVADEGTVMLLGHNPGMEELVEWLVPAANLPRADGKRFPTAAVYLLVTSGSLAALTAGCAQVVAHQRPRLLDD